MPYYSEDSGWTVRVNAFCNDFSSDWKYAIAEFPDLLSQGADNCFFHMDISLETKTCSNIITGGY